MLKRAIKKNQKKTEMALGEREQEREALDKNTKVQVAMQVAQALVYMHGQNPPAVHLDLKPENVLVRHDA